MPNPILPADIERLRQLAGAGGWVTDPAGLGAYLTEWRGLYTGRTPIMVAPDTTEKVAAIVAYCAERRIAVVPQGGNTGLVGGALPGLDGSADEVLLTTRRLNRIHSLDAANLTLTVGAGCILADVQAAAAEADCLFPLSLAAEGSCQIGGNVATNAGGTNVLHYGNTRELVLGLEVVLPDGRVYENLSGLRKDNTGYALDQLFIGAEGTLGIITAVTLKLFPAPRSSVTAWVAVASPAAAIELLRHTRERTGDELVGFELIPRIAIDMVVGCLEQRRDPLPGGDSWYVLIEVAGSREQHEAEALLTHVLGAATDSGLISDGVVATSEAQRQQFWAVRDDISAAQKAAGASIKHDISLPVSAIPEFLERADRLVAERVPGVRPVAFGHLGDGNVHYNLSQPEDMTAEAFLARWQELNELIHSLAVEAGGSFSAEHGIGALKAGELERLGDPVRLDLMRAIKACLDPHGIMNPGKLLTLR